MTTGVVALVVLIGVVAIVVMMSDVVNVFGVVMIAVDVPGH